MQKVYYNIALVAFFGLFFLLMAWNTILVPPSQIPVAMVLIFSITPLLLPLRGFLRGHSKSCAWMAYVSLIYLIHGIVETYANPTERIYAATEAVLALSLFLGATYYVRSFKKH